MQPDRQRLRVGGQGYPTDTELFQSLLAACVSPAPTYLQEGQGALPCPLPRSVGAPGQPRLVLAALNHFAQPLHRECFRSLTPYLYFLSSCVDPLPAPCSIARNSCAHSRAAASPPRSIWPPSPTACATVTAAASPWNRAVQHAQEVPFIDCSVEQSCG